MTQSQWILWLTAGAGLAALVLVLAVLLQQRWAQKANQTHRAWERDETADPPLQVVRQSLIQQQDIFRTLLLRARRDYLQLTHAETEARGLKEVATRTQLTLLQLEELEGDFARTLELKKRAEAEMLKLAQEAARGPSRAEPPA
jgi:hypothetical protein